MWNHKNLVHELNGRLILAVRNYQLRAGVWSSDKEKTSLHVDPNSEDTRMYKAPRVSMV
jgi:hypothetical protein